MTMGTETTKKGRPRAFDRDNALKIALTIFWAKGYKGTQVSDLTAAMHINPPSFYAAFGSKEKTFLEVMDLYIENEGAGSMRALNETEALHDAMLGMLVASIDIALSSPGQKGCLVQLGALDSVSASPALAGKCYSMRRTTIELIQQRLRRGVKSGELSRGVNTKNLAAFFGTVLQGISLRARDGAPRSELLAVAACAMNALEHRPEKKSR